eukprot:TRINITY_DN2555_c0_g1_i1.p1 TRINITY_DN2555_c0_g1~~TRINITY_DN2555_c0_g1_i1.p1  ORF type:complete len:458 (+),score=104.14 TRINITY_DN2555_c0_g1_i1:76-1374(+)
MAPYSRSASRRGCGARPALCTVTASWDAAPSPAGSSGRSSAALDHIAESNAALLERQRAAAERLRRIDAQLRGLQEASPERGACDAPWGGAASSSWGPPSVQWAAPPDAARSRPEFVRPSAADSELELKAVCAGIAEEMDRLRSRILSEPSLLYGREAAADAPDLTSLQIARVADEARELGNDARARAARRFAAPAPQRAPPLAPGESPLAVAAAAEAAARRAQQRPSPGFNGRQSASPPPPPLRSRPAVSAGAGTPPSAQLSPEAVPPRAGVRTPGASVPRPAPCSGSGTPPRARLPPPPTPSPEVSPPDAAPPHFAPPRLAGGAPHPRPRTPSETAPAAAQPLPGPRGAARAADADVLKSISAILAREPRARPQRLSRPVGDALRGLEAAVRGASGEECGARRHWASMVSPPQPRSFPVSPPDPAAARRH